jgi:hypothetical protein
VRVRIIGVAVSSRGGEFGFVGGLGFLAGVGPVGVDVYRRGEI